MDEILEKVQQIVLNVLTSLLTTLLISLTLFCVSWYGMTNEFPPNIASVKEKWAQYQKMIKLSQEAMAKIEAAREQEANGQAPQDPVVILQQMQNAILLLQQQSQGNISTEQWNNLQNRVMRLEIEMQLIKARQAPQPSGH